MILENIPLIGLSAPAILSVAIMMLLTGKLWTNSAYQEKKLEADRWREAYEAEREARNLSDKQTEELLEVTKTTHAFIVAVFTNSERIHKSGVSNDISKT